MFNFTINFLDFKKKKRFWGVFDLFIFEVLIFVIMKPSFEFYKLIFNENRILITLNRTHLSQTLKAFRISA